jgi:hypothetical protein
MYATYAFRWPDCSPLRDSGDSYDGVDVWAGRDTSRPVRRRPSVDSIRATSCRDCASSTSIVTDFRGAEHVGQDVSERIRKAKCGVAWKVPRTPELADRHGLTRRTRSSRPRDSSIVTRNTATTAVGRITQSHDGDRIENPANTGCKTHGDFAAPIVTARGTSGASPLEMNRTSSGVRAAPTVHARKRIESPSLLNIPRSIRRSAFVADLPRNVKASTRKNTSAAMPGGEGYERRGRNGESQPQRQSHDAELLHEGFQDEPLGDEADGWRESGQCQGTRTKCGTTPAHSTPDTPERIQSHQFLQQPRHWPATRRGPTSRRRARRFAGWPRAIRVRRASSNESRYL